MAFKHIHCRLGSQLLQNRTKCLRRMFAAPFISTKPFSSGHDSVVTFNSEREDASTKRQNKLNRNPDLLDVADDWPLHRSNSKGSGQNVRQWRDHVPYNYGLEGPGKSSRRPYDQRKVQITGEILFGIYPVLFALQQNKRQCRCLYVKKGLLKSERIAIRQLLEAAHQRDVKIVPCEKRQLELLSGCRPHQGVCLDASKIHPEDIDPDEEWLTSSAETDNPLLWLAMDSVKDPMNVGAILRSSYFMGVDRVFTCRKDSCRLSPVVSKASAGILELININRLASLPSFLQMCQASSDWTVVGGFGLSDKAPCAEVVPLHETKLTGNTVIVIGNEGSGLSSGVGEACGSLVTILPENTNVRVDSLNVSVATGIILYHFMDLRRRFLLGRNSNPTC